MVKDFDKEIDSLLRQAARKSEAAFAALENPKSEIQNPKSAHVDADEISLFAENVLPAKARTRVMKHLADCERCRKILSNVIALNSETESENVHAKKTAAVSLIPALPWYKKLFVFPQIAYMMGALVLVFSGIIGVLILKNATETQNSSVARMEKVEELPQGASGASSDNETASKEVYSMSNSNAGSNTSMMSNSTASTANVSNSSMNKPSVPLATPNSETSALRDEKWLEADKISEPAPVTTAAPQESLAKTSKKEDSAVPGPPPPPKREGENRNEDEENKRQAEVSQSTMVQNQVQIAPDSRNVQRSAPINGRSMARKDADTVKSADSVSEEKQKTSETRTVGGKTFKRADGVWYDSAYNQQKTKNIRRNTDEYKKLDSGLRSIAENLGGTIVVVWKGKAYRIQ